jgi:hypothetical protein
MDSLYERDFHRWAMEQAAALKDHRPKELDWENLGEEIAALARSERRELRKRLGVLLLHLLKWLHQPNRLGMSWRFVIDEQRERVAELLQDSPSLNSVLDEMFKRAWRDARHGAMCKTGLPGKMFSQNCPWSVAQALDPKFFPQPPLP